MPVFVLFLFLLAPNFISAIVVTSISIIIINNNIGSGGGGIHDHPDRFSRIHVLNERVVAVFFFSSSRRSVDRVRGHHFIIRLCVFESLKLNFLLLPLSYSYSHW